MSVNLTTAERVELVLLYAKQGISLRPVAGTFNAKYPNKQPISRRPVSFLLDLEKQKVFMTDLVVEVKLTLKHMHRCADSNRSK